NAGHPLAAGKHRRVADQHQLGLRVGSRIGEQPGKQLGADACGVAGQDGNLGFPVFRHFSTLTPASRMSFPKRSYSAWLKAANRAISSTPGSPPSERSLAVTSGSAIARSNSARSFATTSCGVPPVVNKPYQVVIATPGKPASA